MPSAPRRKLPRRWTYLGFEYEVHPGVRVEGSACTFRDGWGFRIKGARVHVSQGIRGEEAAHEIAQELIALAVGNPTPLRRQM